MALFFSFYAITNDKRESICICIYAVLLFTLRFFQLAVLFLRLVLGNFQHFLLGTLRACEEHE